MAGDEIRFTSHRRWLFRTILARQCRKESIREDLRATALAADCRSDQSSLPKALLYTYAQSSIGWNVVRTRVLRRVPDYRARIFLWKQTTIGAYR